jgi:hypothetical protein
MILEANPQTNLNDEFEKWKDWLCGSQGSGLYYTPWDNGFTIIKNYEILGQTISTWGWKWDDVYNEVENNGESEMPCTTRFKW